MKRAEDADCTGLTNSNILIIMRLMFRFYFQSQGCHRRAGNILGELSERCVRYPFLQGGHNQSGRREYVGDGYEEWQRESRAGRTKDPGGGDLQWQWR